MSWRQPARSAPARASACQALRPSGKHKGHLPGAEALEERAGPLEIEGRIVGLDGEEEPIPRREREARDVEDGVIWLREAVQGEHPEHGGERCAEDGRLEGGHEERRPAVQRAPADVEGVVDGVPPVLEEVAPDGAEDASGEDEEGEPVPPEAESLRE